MESQYQMLAIDITDPQIQQGLAAAVVLAGGSFAYTSKKSSAPSPPASEAPLPPPPAPKAPRSRSWAPVGGSGAFHVSAGPWPKTPARELWVPPPGWEPPRKPVTSWYDKGDRLNPPAATTAPAPAAASSTSWWDNLVASLQGKAASSPAAKRTGPWPLVGGPGGPHPMSGPWPKTPAREQWNPPEGWTPPGQKAKPAAGAVSSWYDSGLRL